LTVIRGEDMDDVQRLLMRELRSTYVDAQEIKVTILRMEEIEKEPNASLFTGSFTP